MKTKFLLLTTILASGFVLNGIIPTHAADNITTETVKTATSPISNDEINDPRVAAGSFVEHVNYARVALAMNNTKLASQHITQARNMMIIIKAATAEKRLVTEVESGRVIYQYETAYKYHYFPIQTGPVQVKEISNGPAWAENDLAVTDADIVYLTLDLTGDTAEKFLTSAEAAIITGDLKDADNQLAELTDEVVKVSSRATMPHDKAHDNIALARNFLVGKNYAGASFALKHADDALNEMEADDTYKTHRTNIAIMRADVKELQDYITKKDPTMIEKANKKIDKWWKELKTWSKGTK